MFRQADFYNLSGHGHGPGVGAGMGAPGHEPSKVVKLNYTQFSQSIHLCIPPKLFYVQRYFLSCHNYANNTPSMKMKKIY